MKKLTVVKKNTQGIIALDAFSNGKEYAFQNKMTKKKLLDN